MNNQKLTHKLDKQLKEAQINHMLMLQQYRALIGKLVLIAFPQHGINRAFITGIEGDLVGAIAMRTCGQNKDEGEYFDIQQVRIYKVYSEEETKLWEEKFKSERELKVVTAPKA